MIKRLRKHFATDSSKDYYITGAPQCPYPDAMLGTVLDAIEFDAVNVQFYNNYCSTTSSSFNFDAWNAWAKTSPNSNVKVFLGVPGSSTAAGSGYVDFNSLDPIVKELQATYSNFGGVTLWDASASYDNTDISPNYQAGVADLVHGLPSSDGSKGGKITSSTPKKTSTKSHYKATSKTKHHTTPKTSHESSVFTRHSTLTTKTRPPKSISTSSTSVKTVGNTKSSKSTSSHSKSTHGKATKTKTTMAKPTKSKGKSTKKTTTKTTSKKHTFTKSKSTTIKHKPTKTLTSTSESNTGSPTSCVSHASECSTEDQMVCSGDSFATCDHGKWKVRKCPSSLTCFSTTDGTSIYCGQGTSGTTCPAAPKNKLLIGAALLATTNVRQKASFVGGPTAKPYKNSRVIVQFSVTKLNAAGSFEAVLNARRLDQTSFGNTITVSFKVASGIKVTSVTDGTVIQTGNRVKIQYKNHGKRTMAVIVDIEGKVSPGSVLVAPNANSMKFS